MSASFDIMSPGLLVPCVKLGEKFSWWQPDCFRVIDGQRGVGAVARDRFTDRG